MECSENSMKASARKLRSFSMFHFKKNATLFFCFSAIEGRDADVCGGGAAGGDARRTLEGYVPGEPGESSSYLGYVTAGIKCRASISIKSGEHPCGLMQAMMCIPWDQRALQQARTLVARLENDWSDREELLERIKADNLHQTMLLLRMKDQVTEALDMSQHLQTARHEAT
eukprot:1409489-Rhodomonas_salina.4